MIERTSGLLDLLDSENDNDEDEAPTIFQQSPYYNEDGLTEIVSFNPNSFKILSLNCQSLRAKFDQLKVYIEYNCHSCFHAICLQETWLENDSDVDLLQIDGYRLISKGKSASSHGAWQFTLKIPSNTRYVLTIVT
jgi:hypothetical protein